MAMETFSVATRARFDFVDITEKVKQSARALGVKDGVVLIFAPHTTAGITINENADPDVVTDLKKIFNTLVPERNGYCHGEGNAQAHALSSLIGASEQVIVENGELVLGTWQGIYFAEFDGPRTRKAYVKAVTG